MNQDISQHYLQSDNENRDSDHDFDSEDEDDDDEVDKQTSAKPHKQCLKRGMHIQLCLHMVKSYYTMCIILFLF